MPKERGQHRLLFIKDIHQVVAPDIWPPILMSVNLVIHPYKHTCLQELMH